MSKVVSAFNNIDLERFPRIDHYSLPLEKSLWTLCIVKDLGGIKKMTSPQISEVLRDCLEINLTEKSITNSLNRAGDRVYANNDDGIKYYEIMASGREYVMSKEKTETTSLYYFEPEKKYSSKRILSNDILLNLNGVLKIVDPYIGTRTLDILSHVSNNIQFITRMDLLKSTQRNRMVREIKDYKSENHNIEIRDYKNNDLHDRYIVSDDYLVILGHGFKDLGNKESFAVLFDKNDNINVYDAMLENFNRRWKKAIVV